MALIKCPECGGQVSDKAEACIHCGYPLKNISQNAQEKMLKQENLNIHDQKLSLKNTEEWKKENQPVDEEKPVDSSIKNRKRWHVSFILVLLICVLLAGGIFCYKNVYSPKLNYQQANELMKKGNYSEALEIFNELGDYKKSKDNILECEYEIAIVEMQDESKLESAKETFEQLGNYQDSKKFLKECCFRLGKKYYSEGYFKKSLEYITPLKEEYGELNDINNKISIINFFMGDWQTANTQYALRLEINGWDINYYDNNGNITKKAKINQDTVSGNIDNHTNCYFYDSDGLKYYFDDKGFLIQEYQDVDLDFKLYPGDFSKISKEEPQIGMTSEEVLNSTWGEPEDINKDTYSWGIKEQWCYPDNKYIYFEDGNVTSISE